MDRNTFRSHVNFEVMAKLFFDLTEERYPSTEKIKQMVSHIIGSLSSDPIDIVYMKIAILNVMRDMIKEVAPGQLYRSLQHRDELYLAIIEALEDLEDDLEELQEKALGEEDEETEI